MKHILSSLALSTFMLSATINAQTLLYSWENNAEGWATPGGDSPFTSFTESTGVTNGTHAAVRFVQTGFNNEIQSAYSFELRDVLAESHSLSVDITGWGELPTWLPNTNRKITLQILVGNTGGITHDIVVAGLPVSGSGITDTMVWDYSSRLADIQSSDGDWAHIRLVTEFYSGITPGNISFDNMVAVPEPSTVVAALGICAFAFTLIRRKRQR